MLKNKLIAVLICVVSATALSAQKPAAEPVKVVETAKPAEPVKQEPKAAVSAGAEFKPLSFIGFAYAEGTYVLTCGGPKFGFTYGAFGMAAGFYPSLVYSDAWRGSNGALVNPVRPSLGAGIEFSYGKVAVILPVYYLSPNSYYYTIGIGYKF